MLPDLVNSRKILGEESYRQAESIYNRGGVHEDGISDMKLKYLVHDTPARQVTISRDVTPCFCETCAENGTCIHTVAALLKAKASGALNELEHRYALKAAPKLIDSMTSLIPEKGAIHLALNFQIEMKRDARVPLVRVGIRIGDERLYVVRSIPYFLECIAKKEPLEFGKGFTFIPEWMHFSEKDQEILKVFQALVIAQKEANFEYKGIDARLIPLQEPFIELLFSKLKSSAFLLEYDNNTYSVKAVKHSIIPLNFKVEGSLRGLTVSGVYPSDLLPLTSSCSFVLVSGNVIELDNVQRQLICAMWQEQSRNICRFEFPPKDTPMVVDEVIPFLKRVAIVEVAEDLERLLIQVPLKTSVYLDRDGKDILATTTFHYGARDIDPFKPQKVSVTMQRGDLLLMRDAEGERRVLDCMAALGFCMTGGKVFLSGSEAVYNFVTSGVQELKRHADVFVSKDFQKLTPRSMNLHASMSMRGPALALHFTDNDVPVEDILSVLDAISKHKKYFRLKDGTFLTLENLEEWQEFASGVVEASRGDNSKLAAGDIELESYQTFYMTSLLDQCEDKVTRDEKVNQMLEALSGAEEPVVLREGLDSVLRDYQKFGVNWLGTLDKLNMGGVLADDMGLGKTLQAIALLASTMAEGEMSLIVAPTSLTYNWQKEFSVFAPHIRTQVVSGSYTQRQELYKCIKEKKIPDVLITSYPIIRRDIGDMTDMSFRFVVLDEAQQIKNAASAGALAVKQLQAKTRFALTGTPMENHAGELWSIFDFVLPGYLGSRTRFLRRYMDDQNTEELRKKIKPFLLRRLKKDVLDELPDKMETVMAAQMTQEQAKFYQATVSLLRGRVDQVLQEKGFAKGKMEVLSALTQLRQICCHPSLVAENYTGSSGKLEILMDILPTLLSNGRRVLVFSQFTTMLQIMQKQMKLLGYHTLYLDGHVPAEERLHMADEFNAGTGEIFLISLRAGGTGLNLTGADVVIHYDPWWNPAAEDQATDRVYRIGQKHKVDVIRLVTHDTIEEQVVELCQRKKELFQQLITPGEDLVTALSEEEIRQLFQ